VGVVGEADFPKRGEVYLIALDPTLGQEIKKTRPCVVVSPNELNKHLSTFIVAPLTTGTFNYPFRIECRFQKRDGHIVLDQIRTIDRRRLVRRMGRISGPALERVLGTLREMFTS
jgi:mRNA interferase MazF